MSDVHITAIGGPPAPLAASTEGIEQQLYLAAADLALKQLRDGTATSQLITKCLDLGGTREGLEQDLLKARRAKTESEVRQIESQANFEQIAKDALDAMRVYKGEVPQCGP